MTANKPDASADPEVPSSATSPKAVSPPASADPPDPQIAELETLKEQVQKLATEFLTMKANTVRDAALAKAVAGVSSEVAATRAMLTAPTMGAAGYVDAPRQVPVRDDCDDCGCGCVDSSCCCFEIVLDKVRGIQPQGPLEPADMGEMTLPIPTINALEVRFFASIDGIGVLVPSTMSTSMEIRLPSVIPPSVGGPGLWQPLNNVVVGRVCLQKGTTKDVVLDVKGEEVDDGAERPIGFKNEYGEASGSITLNCCMSKIYPPMPIDLSFDQGGWGGGQPGAISLAFFARRVCC